MYHICDTYNCVSIDSMKKISFKVTGGCLRKISLQFMLHGAPRPHKICYFPTYCLLSICKYSYLIMSIAIPFLIYRSFFRKLTLVYIQKTRVNLGRISMMPKRVNYLYQHKTKQWQYFIPHNICCNVGETCCGFLTAVWYIYLKLSLLIIKWNYSCVNNWEQYLHVRRTGYCRDLR